MTTTFVTVDAIVVVLAVAIEAVVILRWVKKHKGSDKAGK